MNMETLMVVLGLWFAIGLLVALVFGRFVQVASGSEDTDGRTPSSLRYLRPTRRHSTISTHAAAAVASVKHPRRIAAPR
jgi:hypothetical protein